MERTSLWILLLALVTAGGTAHGQSCRQNAPRRDCGKPEGFSRVLITYTVSLPSLRRNVRSVQNNQNMIGHTIYCYNVVMYGMFYTVLVCAVVVAAGTSV